MQTFLQDFATTQAALGLSIRQLCAETGLPYTTCQRWRQRQRNGAPLLRPSGPGKTGPLPLAQVQAQIQQLVHGRRRTQGTTALYRQHEQELSRRQLGTLVQAERQRLHLTRLAHTQTITWHDAQTAWAMDGTQWGCNHRGQPLFVLLARDLATRFCLAMLVCTSLLGGQVAAFLKDLFAKYGPPLFLKRDNGSNLQTPEVEQVLADCGVIPLNSPVQYPQYNGGMEKQIGDLKRLLPFGLPSTPPQDDHQTLAILEAVRHCYNAKPRADQEGCSPFELFHRGPRLRVPRPERTAIFDLLSSATLRKLLNMENRDHRSVDAAWRSIVVTWLRRQQLISVSNYPNPQPRTNPQPKKINLTNNNCYPFFPLNDLINSKS